VSADADRHDGTGGGLIVDARHLVAQADEVLTLAVPTARGRGTVWKTVGEQLEASAQAAQQRFGHAVQTVEDGIEFPRRAPADVGRG